MKPNKCPYCGNEMTFTFRIIENGSRRVNQQCQHCGYHLSSPYKLKLFNLDELPLLRNELMEQYRQNKLREYEYNSLLYLDRKADLKNKYTEYIGSFEWKQKRQIAFKKWGTNCKICNCENANEVHHVSYKNLYNETDKDLIVLCHDCHINLIHSEKYPDFKIQCEIDEYDWGLVCLAFEKLDIKNSLAAYNHITEDNCIYCELNDMMVVINVAEILPINNKVIISDIFTVK